MDYLESGTFEPGKRLDLDYARRSFRNDVIIDAYAYATQGHSAAATGVRL